jgi:endonuclease I
LYYQNIDSSLAGPQLREVLHRLIRNNQQLTYRQLWDALAFTDEDEDDASKVVLFYTDWKRDKDDHGGDPHEWNREHVWPKSKGHFGTRPGAGTDLHHIRPTDVSVNGARGSLSFDNGGNIYDDPDGPTQNRFDDDSWEPWDEVKGDVARMLFYMAVRYEEPSLDLEVVDSTPPQSSQSPQLGKLSTLLQWHQDDPVSSFERRRNERIHLLQGNRNPFIDQPQWVNRIWP